MIETIKQIRQGRIGGEDAGVPAQVIIFRISILCLKTAVFAVKDEERLPLSQRTRSIYLCAARQPTPSSDQE